MRSLVVALLLLPLTSWGSADISAGDYLQGNYPLNDEPLMMCAWFKRTNTSATQTIMSIGQAGAASGNHAFELNISSGDLIRGRSEGTTGQDVDGPSIGNDTTNWHLACYRTESDTSRYAGLDGTFGTENTTNVAVTSANIDVIRIGLSTQSGDATAPLGALVAHVMVYNLTGMSSGDITAAFTALASGDNPLAVEADNLVAYYPLTDNGDYTDHQGSFDLTNNGSSFSADNPTVDAPPAGDTTPDAFSFTDQTNVSLSSTITSAAVTITGIDASITCSATGGTLDLNSDGTFSSSRTVSNNDTIRARHTSSASNSTATNTVVDCGTGPVSDTFTSTTEAAVGSSIVPIIEHYRRQQQ